MTYKHQCSIVVSAIPDGVRFASLLKLPARLGRMTLPEGGKLNLFDEVTAVREYNKYLHSNG